MKKEKQQKRPKRTKAQRVQALKTFAVDTVYDVVGSILFAIGVYTFAKSADFAPGGVSGLALICNYLWDLPIGTMTLIINIPIIIISYKVVGRKFLLKSFKTMVISTLFLDLVFPLTPLYTGNSFLAAIFSGVFMGAGLALIYMRGSSTGGTDFLIVTIKKLKPHFSMGQVTLMTDLVVIVLGGFVFGNIDAVLYGVISTYAASVIIDKIIYGAGSGKLATCLSQVYHEIRQGRVAGYAKFETFPIWNLPLKHPVNLAYEAATADLADVNMIDPFHLEAYGVTTVNYNRDVEAFPIVRNILSRITGDESVYKSPTDMGVNMAGYAIVDDEAVRAAASQEIIRRYYKALCDHKQGKGSQDAVDKIKRIMQELSLTTADRAVVAPALAKSESSGVAAAAIQLPDGPIVTGKASNLMSACSSCVLNAIKAIAGIDDSLTLISPIILEPILKLKIDILGSRSSVLKVDDVLAALSITAATNTLTARAMAALPKLRDCEMHSTCMLHSGDEGTLRKMGLRLTSEPEYPSKDLFF